MGGYDTDGTDHSPPPESRNGWETHCNICKKWFYSSMYLEFHYTKYSSGCAKHQACFAWEENYDHASNHEHDRCFITSCRSKYATEGGWKNSEVKSHVGHEHLDDSTDSGDSE